MDYKSEGMNANGWNDSLADLLEVDETYYVTVKALNNAGLWGSKTSGKGYNMMSIAFWHQWHEFRYS